MSQFRGINSILLDAKGRMAMPSRYRDLLHKKKIDTLVITIDTESPCLLLYTLPEWEMIEEKLQALPSFNSAARRIQRLLIGHATELEMDGSGRVLVPPLLREYAKLDKRLMLVGQGKKFEVWDEHHWHSNRTSWLAEACASDTLPDEIQMLAL